MWQDLAAAFGLMLVLEGIGPFLSPATMRRVFEQASRLHERTLRYVGLGSMLIGLLFLYLFH
ncbi:MAG: hypothetical protein NFCOHLIN_00036 [Gammaproteobacteria bacterium]|nr:hypothetical protein [Gammaproteobacteria bacterium]